MDSFLGVELVAVEVAKVVTYQITVPRDLGSIFRREFFFHFLHKLRFLWCMWKNRQQKNEFSRIGGQPKVFKIGTKCNQNGFLRKARIGS